MAKNVLELNGMVIEALPNALFRVRLDNELELICHISGKIRVHRIRILPGDTVIVEVSPYDLSKGRISRRL